MPERVLVTGAGGFVGRHVVDELARAGYEVKASDLSSADLTYARDLGATLEQGDLAHFLFCRRAVSGCDMVVHTAAAFDLSLPRSVIIERNVGTTRNITAASAHEGVALFVHYSTCDVYGLKRGAPTREEDSRRPDCAYSVSKMLSELMARGAMSSGLPVAVIRPTYVYGPGALYTARSFLALPALARRYTTSVPLPVGGPRINAIHVEDLAAATVSVLRAGPAASGRAFNVADDSWMDAGEFLRLVFEPFGIGCSRDVKVPWALIEGLARLAALTPMRLIRALNAYLVRRWDALVLANDLDPSLSPRIDRDFVGFIYGDHCYANDAIKSLGWKPAYPTFADGWPSTVAWYRENRLIP